MRKKASSAHRPYRFAKRIRRSCRRLIMNPRPKGMFPTANRALAELEERLSLIMGVPVIVDLPDAYPRWL